LRVGARLLMADRSVRDGTSTASRPTLFGHAAFVPPLRVTKHTFRMCRFVFTIHFLDRRIARIYLGRGRLAVGPQLLLLPASYLSAEEGILSKKPMIGMNADFRDAQGDNPSFSYVASGYYDAVLRSGGIPLVLPPVEDEDDLSQLLGMVDGLLLIGGADLDPRRDGFMLHPTLRLLARRRESFDRQLVRMAEQRKIPIMGIGAGMQLLNVSLGGNLSLHIPEDMPEALPHRDPIDAAHRHTLEVETNTLMERVYGDGEIRVNSMHHMAIDEVASSFRVTARCPDGVIEAIESVRSDWFAVGTQFHPEAESASALDVRIFEEFLAGVTGEALQPMQLVA